MIADKIDRILQRFVKNSRSVRDAVLVSNEAEPIAECTEELDDNSTMGMAVATISLEDSTRDYLGWPEIAQIWLQAKDGHFIRVRCTSEAFLMVKASKDGKLGGLRMEIEGLVKELQAALNEDSTPQPPANQKPLTSPEFNSGRTDTDGGNEFIYRGRRMKS